MTILINIKEEVSKLYEFRDDYFQNHEIDEASKKEEEINIKLKELIILIDGHKGSIPTESKGEYHFLKGKALNVLPNYNSAAEEELGRATKFNFPSAWNELGECLYKKGDLNGAKTCFLKALAMEKNAVFLRNMSMLMRSLPCNTKDEKEENILKGLEYARESLKLNLTDGHSWLVLGNSYLTSFFTVESKQEILSKCKVAYTKAESDPKAAHLPELHYSKFQIYWYEEGYNEALSSLKKAQELEPTWTDPKMKYDECRKFLFKLSNLVHNKGRLSQRKLTHFINGINSSQLGPYVSGGTTLTNGLKPTLVPLKLLSEGMNHEKIVQGKVVCTVVPDSGLPFAFCLVDREGTCKAVTVYNWASNCGVKIGDSVAIVAPVLKRHVFDDLEIKEFLSIRLSLPIMMVVNKRCVSTKQVIASQVVSEKKSD